MHLQAPQDETLLAALATAGATVEVDEAEQTYVVVTATGARIPVSFGASYADFVKAVEDNTPVAAVAPVETSV